ncbi:MAG TPA: D-alanyl-D-alanine carboxypeptidase/D-alanyl-D-alanine-endopeptidase [Chitinophagaceae bacterium]
MFRLRFLSARLWILTTTAHVLLLASCSVQKRVGRSATKNVLLAPALQTAHVGISIYEPATNKYWYNYQADKFFVPASNTKIPTCYAAMKYLDDSLPGIIASRDNASGKLLIAGTGDPTFLHPDFKNQPVLDFLRNENKQIVVTNPEFKTRSLGSGWAWNDYNEYYMAERSALPLYGNIGRWKLGSTSSGKISLTVIPRFFQDSLFYSAADFSSVDSRDTAKKNWRNLDVRRKKESNAYEVTNASSIFSEAEIPFETTSNATIASMLIDTLKLAVDVDYGRRIMNGTIIRSQPTDSMLKPMMHRSDNFFAEQSLLLVSNKLLGVLSDQQVIDTLLKTDFKDLPQKPRWADGSGLSRYNLFTPQDMVAILNKMQQQFPMARIKEIFATGGEGTISSYYKTEAGYIYAKTGTLSGVVALSGFLYTKRNRLLLFSVLVNNHQASSTDVRRAVEKFIKGIRNDF